MQSHDKIYIDEYYNTPERIKEALVAAYDPLQWFDYGLGTYNPIPLIYEVMADDFYPGGSNNKDMEPWHLMFNYQATSTNVPSTVWTAAYSGVNRANCVAKYMPNVVGIDDQTKSIYLAESVVLRTWYYTQLWKLWGNIPYYETNLQFPYICEQSTADQVYGKMVATLESVIDSDVLPMKRTTELGRITQAMAMMLYADIVLYQNTDQQHKQKALDYMETIINSLEYSLLSSADLPLMWEQEKEWCPESIFEINFMSKDAVRNWNNPLACGGSCIPELLGIRNLNKDKVKPETKWMAGLDAYGFFPVTNKAVQAFEEGDLRKDVTIYRPDSEGYVSSAEASEGYDYEARFQFTGNYIAKFLPRKDGNEGQKADYQLNFNNNIRLYRYAETLLNAAELIAVHGCSGKGTADAYLNEVRSRAGLGTVSADAETILHERHVEFMGEGKRYWDLIRSGKAAEVLTPDNELPDFSGQTHRVNSWNENKKYLPIPQTEIDAAQGTLTQNNY